MKIDLNNLENTMAFGRAVGECLRGGEVFELVGDVGAGKTSFTKGLGAGLAVEDDVQSPSFTLSRVYEARDGLQLHHYDFYRLAEPGILAHELAESLDSPEAVTVIEWAETVADVLPENRIVLTFYVDESDDQKRQIKITNPSPAVEEAYVFWSAN